LTFIGERKEGGGIRFDSYSLGEERRTGKREKEIREKAGYPCQFRYQRGRKNRL